MVGEQTSTTQAPIQQNLLLANEPSEVEALLADTDPDEMTPKQAHALLYQLKSML